MSVNRGEEETLLRVGDRSVLSIDNALSTIGFGRFHWMMLLVCGIGYTADNMWTAAVSLILPPVAIEWDVEDNVGLLASLLFAGQGVGALFWGRVSDKKGRKLAFTCTLLIAGVCGGSGAFSPNFYVLGAALFALGFGVGGNLPVDGAIFAEFMPAEQRGKMMVLLSVFWMVGSLLAYSIAWGVIPMSSCEGIPCKSDDNRGWRYLLLALGASNLLMMASRMGTPESPRYFLTVGKHDEAREVLIRIDQRNAKGGPRKLPREFDLEMPPRLKNSSYKPLLTCTTALLVFIWFSTNLAFTSFNMFLPTLLKSKGITVKDTYRNAFIYGAAGLPGVLLGCVLVESRLGRRYTMGVFTLVSAGLLALFSNATTSTQIILYSSLTSCTTQVMFAGLYAYTPEVYPTNIRSSAVGLCSMSSRVAGIIAPAVAPRLMKVGDAKSGGSLLYVAISLLGLAGVAMLSLRVESRGLALD